MSHLEVNAKDATLRRRTAKAYLDTLATYQGSPAGRLLDLACADGELLIEAAARGFDVHGDGVVRCPIDVARFPDHHFDVCVCGETFEGTHDPIELLSEVRRVLKPSGVLLLVTSTLSLRTLENVLARTGFRSVEIAPARKILNHEAIKVPASRVVALARAVSTRSRPLLSIIVPVYNERRTVRILLEALVAKDIVDLDKEIIIVEGNSTDGTREEVLRFRNTAGVHLVLQDQARGKGLAVREGLRCASGDIVLIQDADLEYDLGDYDSLLEPILTFREAVVLGSRHGGDAKIRKFTDQPLLGLIFRAGHLFLTALFNALYGQSLKDPWTMYKIFRRDCLHMLAFECNRFNFDVELLAKLIRKGYRPLEIDVRYQSRSFKDGKKIRPFSDPWTWVWACVKYRFVTPYGDAETS
jgi:SAM-dependent methyltransferase